MATLLVRLEEERRRRCDAARLEALNALHAALPELLPAGSRAWAFGSVVKPGRFHEESDIDLAVDTLPPGRSEYWLHGELERRLGRAVDLVLIGEIRLREKIEREEETWTW